MFKKSFTLYVESGMRKKTEKDVDNIQTLIYFEQSGCLVIEDFKATFCKFIYKHLLRKFLSHCFYNHFFHLNTAHPEKQLEGFESE